MVGELVRFLRDEPRLVAAVPSLGATETRALFVSAASRARLLEGSHAADRIRTVRELVSHVVVGKTSLEIGVRESGLRDVQTAQERIFSITFAAQLKRGNHATRLVLRDATTEAKVPDAGLVALLARAHRWLGALLSGRHDSIMALAKVERQAGRDITRTIYLAFLAPDIVERFVRGEQPLAWASGA